MLQAIRVAPVLPVRNVTEALARFRALGFEGHAYGKDETVDGPIYGFVSKGSVELHLALTKNLDPKANTSACYLYVDDASAVHDAWSKADPTGRFTAPVDTPYQLREFTYIDVDGNLLRVGSELRPGGH
jgi:hypothetical protein